MKKLAFASLFFIAALWTMIAFAPQLVLPGAMGAGHQELGQDCFACHTPFSGPSQRKCLGCHEPDTIDSARKAAPAFHNRLTKADCMACHNNHQGRYSQQNPKRFTHELLDTAILNDCVSCHAAPGDTLHASLKGRCSSCHGTQSWQPARFDHAELVGTTESLCRDCHKPPENEVHISSNPDCAQCHNVSSWQPATFDHDRYFRFDEDHEASCITCHPVNTFDTYTCYGCHEHSSAKLAREHREEGIQDFQNCVECHRSGDEHEVRRGQQKRYRGGDNDHDDHDRDHGKGHGRKLRHSHKHDRHDDD